MATGPSFSMEFLTLRDVIRIIRILHSIMRLLLCWLEYQATNLVVGSSNLSGRAIFPSYTFRCVGRRHRTVLRIADFYANRTQRRRRMPFRCIGRLLDSRALAFELVPAASGCLGRGYYVSNARA